VKRVVITVTALAAWLTALVVDAHEIGTTRVNVRFDSKNEYSIVIVTDAASLVEKLDAASGRTAVANADDAELALRLHAYDAMFRRRVRVEFGVPAERPAIEYHVTRDTRAAPAMAIVTLRGHMPTGASHFRWSYGWTFASYALTVECESCAAPVTQWLDGDETGGVLPSTFSAARSTRMRIARQYFALGFTHILPYGLDHVLFVLGIFLLTRVPRQVLAQVSAFTIAHSITLALSMYGVLSAPARLVEPMIAISIAYVAIENLLLRRVKPWRIALVFAFGLLHGLGFAGALQELGLPRSEFVTALLTFNLGVEGGQLTVIALAFLATARCTSQTWYRSRIVIPASLTIACISLYWTAVRL
jgi:hydrogenase/urease accessory protein HupE